MPADTDEVCPLCHEGHLVLQGQPVRSVHGLLALSEVQVPPGADPERRAARAQAARRGVPRLRQAAAAAHRSIRRVRRLLGLPRLQVHKEAMPPRPSQADRREVPAVRRGEPGRAHRALRSVRRLLALPRMQVPRQHRQGRQAGRRARSSSTSRARSAASRWWSDAAGTECSSPAPTTRRVRDRRASRRSRSSGLGLWVYSLSQSNRLS